MWDMSLTASLQLAYLVLIQPNYPTDHARTGIVVGGDERYSSDKIRGLCCRME